MKQVPEEVMAGVKSDTTPALIKLFVAPCCRFRKRVLVSAGTEALQTILSYRKRQPGKPITGRDAPIADAMGFLLSKAFTGHPTAFPTVVFVLCF